MPGISARIGQAAFWSGVARRYAEMPMRNPEAYEVTLGLVRQHLRSDHSVLELGCGTGTTAVRLARDVARYVATDFAPEMIAIADEKRAAEGLDNLYFEIGSLGRESLPKGPFDAILAFNFLHLLPDRRAALGEVLEMLPRGGCFISKTPCLGGFYRVLQPVVAVLRRIGKAPDIGFLTPKKLELDIRYAGFEVVETGSYPRHPPSRFVVARKP